MAGKKLWHPLSDLGSWITVMGGKAWQSRFGKGSDPVEEDVRQVERELVQALHPKRMKLELREVRDETPTTKTLRFARTDAPLPPFRPGQYVNLFLEVDGTRTSRPYSIASAPGDELLELTIRAKPGGFVSTHLLDKAQPGQAFESTGPVGHFRYEPLIDGERLVFLAGGSGITPFMSMIRDQAKRGFPLDITLLYGSRVADDVIFGAELSQLAHAHERFRYVPVISEPPKGFDGESGFMSAELIARHVPDALAERAWYLCGPNVMLRFCKEALAELGVPRYRIRTEVFGPPEEITGVVGWPDGVAADATFEVRIEGREAIRATASEPLMVALERHGVVIPALCRTGGCSRCRTKVRAGEVFIPPGTGVRASDRERGFVHACAAYPVSDLEIVLSGRG